MSTIKILFIHHEDSSTNAAHKASVWITACEDVKEYPPQSKDWIKLIGPVEMAIAEEISDSLGNFFRQNGIDVKDETIAD